LSLDIETSAQYYSVIAYTEIAVTNNLAANRVGIEQAPGDWGKTGQGYFEWED
jgi:hypothetical protein